MVSGETFIIIIIIIIIISFITVFAGVLFVHQQGANHASRASVTPVNHSVHTLSASIIICIIIIIKKKTPVLNTTTIDVSLEAPKGDGPFQSTLSQPME